MVHVHSYIRIMNDRKRKSECIKNTQLGRNEKKAKKNAFFPHNSWYAHSYEIVTNPCYICDNHVNPSIYKIEFYWKAR